MKQALIVVDLGFGDAGKGTTVDFLTRQFGAHTIVRFNGGAQAGHNVVTPDGRHHTFAQFGSGSLVPGVRTHLSEYMLVNPLSMAREAEHLEVLGLRNPMSLLTVDTRAVITTPFHQSINQLREIARGSDAHGSCGMGIGETMEDLERGVMLQAGDLTNPTRLRRQLLELQDLAFTKLCSFGHLLPDTQEVADALRIIYDTKAWSVCAERFAEVPMRVVESSHTKNVLESGTVVFEGAQGVLLDENYGFHPHTTWSRTTPENALRLLGEFGYSAPVTKIGVMRTYMTRHGAGPFPTEDKALTHSLPDPYNGLDRWQGGFRVGHLDLPLLQYALTVAKGVDYLAVTHIDHLDYGLICMRYSNVTLAPDSTQSTEKTTELSRAVPQYNPVDKGAYLSTISSELGTSARLFSYGPTATEKRLDSFALVH